MCGVTAVAILVIYSFENRHQYKLLFNSSKPNYDQIFLGKEISIKLSVQYPLHQLTYPKLASSIVGFGTIRKT